MRSKRYLIITLLLVAGVSLATSLIYKLGNKPSPYANYKSYDSLWVNVDTCEAKGLTQDALKLVMNIYNLAKKDHNAPQLVKTVIYRAKYANGVEEFSDEKNIAFFNKETESAEFPAKAVLHSILAEQYWNYYEQRRWQLLNQSTVVDLKTEDVSTHDARALLNKVIWHYQQSLKGANDLKKIPVKEFDKIVVKGNEETRKWRPYLYDLLAHRALEFFKNSEAEVTKAGNRFSLNEEVYLKPFPDFLKANISKPQDSLELKYYSLKLYQDLLNFHSDEGNEAALADLELRRFEFLKQESQHPLKDSLYLQSMNCLSHHFGADSRAGEFKHAIANWWLQQAENFNALAGDAHKWDKKKAADMCLDIMSKNINTRGEALARNTFNEINSKSLSLSTEEVLDRNVANRALCNYKNINKLYFRVVKMNYEAYQNILRNDNSTGPFTILSKLPSVKTFSIELPDDKDYNLHSVEAAIPALDFGYYVLLSSDNVDFKSGINSHQAFTVSDLAFISKIPTNGANTYRVLNRQSGKALSGVQAILNKTYYDYSKRNYITQKAGSYTSDKNGIFTIERTKDYDRYQLQLVNGKDTLIPDKNIFTYENDNYDPTYRKTFIFTDRAIYRPGQTIYYKAIALSGKKNNFKVLPKTEVKLVFYDVNNQKLAEQKQITNDYGTVSGSFVAPQGVLTGNMRITDDIGEVNISVEEYKRPKFEVLFDTLKGSYKLNDEVTVKGFAKAFAGNNIDGAKVTFRVSRNVNFPNWYYWYRPSFNQGGEAEMMNGELSTNASGEFEIKFKAQADPTVSKENNPDFTFTIYADVTDVNGETRSASVSTHLGYKMLQLNFSAPEIINRQKIEPVSIVATNLNGVEENVSGELMVYKLKQNTRVFRKRLWQQPDKHLYSKEEYYKLFPNDMYDDESNQYKWERNGNAFSRAFESKSSRNIIINEFKKLEPGVYCVEALCKDKAGEEVKSLNYITVYDPSSSKLPVNEALWEMPLNTTVEPGNKASFIAASSYKDVEVFYDLESENTRQSTVIHPSLKPIEIAVEEKNRGGMIAYVSFVKFGRVYTSRQFITVPFSNKELDVQFSTFRNKLVPGQSEEWKLTLKNKKGEKVAAELLAAMYDASLDVFKPNNWSYYLYNDYFSSFHYEHSLEGISDSQTRMDYTTPYSHIAEINYDQLYMFDMNGYLGTYGWGGGSEFIPGRVGMLVNANYNISQESKDGPTYKKFKHKVVADSVGWSLNSSSPGGSEKVKFVPPVIKEDAVEVDTKKEEEKGNASGVGSVSARKNFNETAFFFPQLSTNENGEVVIKFTIPESLTRWKVMALAHTKDLAFGFASKECITQKELMVVPNAPRFLREGDELIFSGKISNLSDKELSGKSELRFFDAITEKEISAALFDKEQLTKDFTCKKGTSTLLEWKLKVPMALQAVKYKLVAKAGNFSDGEEMVLPVLSNRLLVSESMPLPIRGNQTKDFNFVKFTDRNHQSTTLQDHAYTLEFTSNPAWYAVQSLPYLMEYPYECAEQTFSRYYSNALATHIANSKPKIKAVFEAWKNQSPQAFLFNLEKNQELKAVLLQETPWVLESQNESENKKRMGLLFDLNRMSNELNATLNKLEKMQTVNGGWPWFQGCPEDRYITQHIACGLAHLQKLGIINSEKDAKTIEMMNKAVAFCDAKLAENFKELKRMNKKYLTENLLSSSEIQYLYMRSYFSKTPVPEQTKEAFNYYKKQAQTYWLKNSRYLQGMVALALNRLGDKTTAMGILKSLKQNAIVSEEMGMYWKDNAGYFWHEAPIEKQAMLIEAFSEVSGDMKAVDDMKTWLIKNKQTNNWGTTRATTEAVYAMLLNGGDWLSTEPDVEITLGKTKLDPKNDASLKAEPGTGYFKKRFSGKDIQSDMGKIQVKKYGTGVSWGAVYWQYFEQMDKITPHATPLMLSKKLFLQKNSASGPVITQITPSTELKVGDKVIVRIELRSDRDMEYVHLKDMRASGFEPVNVLSSYKYNNGLGYYESTGDAASNFFISYLPKGTYVFEYPVFVSHKGNFGNGISSIQCMYAPEFTSHSEGIRVQVGGK